MTTWPWQGDASGQNFVVLFLFVCFSFPKQTSTLIHLSIWLITTKASGCTSLKILYLCVSSNTKFRPAAVSTKPIPWGCTNTKALFTELLKSLLIKGLLLLSVKRPMYSTSKLSILAFWFLPPPFTLFEACFCSKGDACLAAVSVALARASKWLCRDAPAGSQSLPLGNATPTPPDRHHTSVMLLYTGQLCPMPGSWTVALGTESISPWSVWLQDQNGHRGPKCTSDAVQWECQPPAVHPQMEQQGCKINGAF